MELQKHFERQMQQILEAVSEMEGGKNNNKQIKTKTVTDIQFTC